VPCCFPKCYNFMYNAEVCRSQDPPILLHIKYILFYLVHTVFHITYWPIRVSIDQQVACCVAISSVPDVTFSQAVSLLVRSVCRSQVVMLALAHWGCPCCVCVEQHTHHTSPCIIGTDNIHHYCYYSPLINTRPPTVIPEGG